MGGRGSGRSASYGLFVDKVEDYQSIDLAWLRKKTACKVHSKGMINWSRRGERYASVGYHIEAGGLRLLYRTRLNGGEWSHVDELIPFIETATQFGGNRRWFSCPGCSRRCRIVYGGAYFRCRKCHGLQYESQYENAICRAASQRHKIRERLGHVGPLDDAFPTKPKGMHWKTYLRLAARDEVLERFWYAEIADWLKLTNTRRRIS